MQLKVILLTIILRLIIQQIQVLWKAMAALFYFLAVAEVAVVLTLAEVSLQEEVAAVVVPPH